MTVLPSQPCYSRLLTIRIYWDGEKEPSVQCPIGDFFGVGLGLERNVNSIPVRVSAEGRARSCYWVMPFRKSARVTVTNDGDYATWGFYYQVDGIHEKVKEDAPYFHAMYRQQYPTKPGNYVIADIKGRGHYVGTVLSVRSTTEGWFGEGNDYFFVDGETTPSLKGTGFEDYFGEAWALRETTGPYAGCALFEGGFVGARASCYRWHLPDPVRFEHGLRVEMQHQGVGPKPGGNWGNNVERADEYSSVAFWYQIGPHAPYPSMPEGMDRLAFDYRLFESAAKMSLDPPKSGKVDIIKQNGLRSNSDVNWTGARDGADLNIPFSVKSDGQYQIMVLITKSSDGGLAQFLLDGKKISDPVSFYGDDEKMHEAPLEFRNLSVGTHVLTLRCLGRPAGAEDGRRFAIDGMIVQPLRK